MSLHIIGDEEPKISDYALIGNCCAAALVSRYGSIDWCCLPEFHSPSVFAALLDRKKGGCFMVSPAEEYRSSQSYLPDTNVVETRFKTPAGEVKLLDAFTAAEEEDKMQSLFPDHEILRMVEGVSGEIKMKVDFCPRIFYGKIFPELKDYHKLGIKVSWKENTLIFISTLDQSQIKVDPGAGKATAEFTIREGEKVFFSLSFSNQGPAVIPELHETAAQRMDKTIVYWRRWVGKCKYTGVYQEQVKRSVLTLKLLANAPSGAIIAAPTTSLPEEIGGERNWDYRYCWLRDASFTIRVLLKLGFEDEAHAYMNWILHATRLTQPKLQVVYSVYGHAHLEEKTLDWLSGYEDSKPVRIGNKADSQFQLDVYGEVLDAVYSYAQIVKEFDRVSRRFVIGIGKVICKMWREPDNGIWEIRSPGVHHTHSKVMAWVGLDRLVKLCERYHWTEAPLPMFKDALVEIRSEIEDLGYNTELNSYTRGFNGNKVDASLLTLSLVGYCHSDSLRMVSTVKLIKERLLNNDLVYRYRDVEDGLEGDEGAFALCNFWLAENLVQSGEVEEGIRIFEAVLKHASPAGLLSEEIDPESHDLLGNYPQGFTHIGLINAAISINEAVKKQTVKA